MLPDFQLAGGSVAGRDHRRGVPKNCQDAYCIRTGRTAITAIVADGCGSSERSEVGAGIAVEQLSTFLHELLDRGFRPGKQLLERARQDLLSHMRVLAKSMGPSLSKVVNRFFLFTLLGTIVTNDTTLSFALGDGIVVINGEVIVLEPEIGNQPIYLGYALTGSELTDHAPERLEFQVVYALPTTKVDHFLLGSDGATEIMNRANDCLPGRDEQLGPISQFWETDRVFGTRLAIQTRLNLMARDRYRITAGGRAMLDGGKLSDDTTVVVGRRTPALQEA